MEARMIKVEGCNYVKVLLLIMVLIPTLLIIPVNAAHPELSDTQILTSDQNSPLQKIEFQGRRMLIGSTAPTCTYNECRGCKFRCRAEQVPVDGNDPVNSAYRYKCVCHR
ncbi:hypothetical protein RND81_13G158300 [Saponaria officinalis]|uniref:Stomagen C-terminal domain-containing protein n=1 Tax=Saponaria officinalis TaxID=3572 RepID=A0AAW1H154_SAPOF